MEKSKIRLTYKEIYDFCIFPIWGDFEDRFLYTDQYGFDIQGLANSNYTEEDIKKYMGKHNPICRASVLKLLPELIKQKELELYNKEFTGLLKDD